MPIKDKKKATRYRLKHKQKEKDYFVSLFGNKCFLCHGTFHPAAFDFHHIDPTKKDMHITGSKSYKVRLEELKKCVMLCSNCHRTIHAALDYDLSLSDD